MTAGDRLRDHLFDGRRSFEANHVRAGRHHFGDFGVVKFEERFDHRFLPFENHSFPFPELDRGSDALFRNLGIGADLTVANETHEGSPNSEKAPREWGEQSLKAKEKRQQAD